MASVSQRWNKMPLLWAGLGLLTLFFVLLLSLTQRQLQGGGASVEAQQEPVVWRRLVDEGGRFSLLYPTGWNVEQDEQTLLLWPASDSERGAALELQLPPIRNTRGDLGADALRYAQNVAVGGVSGSETIYRLGAAAQSAMGDNLLDALRGRGTEDATLVIWQSPAEQPRFRVTMLDAGQGDFLPLLEQIRESIQWGTE